MLTHKDQLDLFTLVAKKLTQDVECYAFGGNAMMFYGYKEETKDVDLLFEEDDSRKEFIRAISSLGYAETSPIAIYIPEKLRDLHRPLMYKRGESRFDLFVKKIFKTLLSPNMKENVFAVHEFKEKYNLKIKVLRKEYLIILKAVTSRDKDFEDILTILQKNQDFDWRYLIDEVLWQYKHGDSWVLLDMERVMQELKKYVFIEEKYFKQLYNARKRHNQK
ncbi:hypothetical protein HZC30_00210 [Candidatus Woesearchaeota archaeon]|nr:hypothetical protein [Candidatus Woesearchaeota archaeon]